MKSFDDQGLSVKVVRAASFSAAHRYFNASLSKEENEKAFGSLIRDDGFGHNFLVEVHITGPIDPLTGMIVNLSDIDRWIKDTVVLVDHKNLNELPFFSGQNPPPTPETIARFFYDEIQKKVLAYAQPYSGSKVTLTNVRVFEGDDLWADYGV